MGLSNRSIVSLAVAASIAAAACVVGTAAAPPSAAAVEEPAPESVVVDEPQVVEAVEPGFVHCCGTNSYRIEIQCSSMIKRCYKLEAAGWTQTYGRHCRTELSRGCYLEECDAHCQ